ncbi:PREDICTED: putative E3 ubiquitin-protein ligase RF298 [Ipomoea nil]|uniref:putative E3 ubiquitin-protein ligase RF298 n=1 Tax=Ipomoea nil TaxID=35883 RepID=UPI000900DCAC|nr:PREDICTED: putative E3 ubiquitin-protein ligase RF298 [Ipomoea nil]
MADQRAKQAGDSNEESLQVFPAVNDRKGKRKVVEFPSDRAKNSSSSSTELRSCELNERSDQSDAKEWPEEKTPLYEWEDPMAVELEKLLIPSIKKAILIVIKKIVECGFSEEVAEWGVFNSGAYQGYLDIISNMFNSAWAFLACCKKEDFDSAIPLFDGIESLSGYILLEMVCVLKEVKPFLSVADAMWLLLICDLNLLKAVEHGTVNPNPVLCSCCTSKASQCKNETPKDSSRASDVSAPEASGSGRKGSSGLRKKVYRTETNSKGGKRRGGRFITRTRMTTSIDVTVSKPLISQPVSSSGGKKEKGGVVSVSSLPAVTSKAAAMVKQESKLPIWKPPGPSAVPSSVHMTEKDERIMALMVRKQLLQQELQGWNDWASVKVREAAQKLSKDKAELRKLRQEREEAANFEALMDEKIKQRQSELRGELSDLQAQMGASNSAVQRLEAERAKLVKGIADSEMKNAQSYLTLEETVGREQELLKQCQTLEGEASSLQEYLARLNGEAASLQAGIEKARKREGEFEALRQHEEREKIKILQKLESIRSEREQLNCQAKGEEGNLRAIAVANRLEYEERKSKVIAEIFALRANPGQGGVKREWECIMCLSKATSVLFLPCAHQVLCKDCNTLHENPGMKDCPSCRTTIVQRIHVRFPPRIPH